jgi:hypothetical protein
MQTNSAQWLIQSEFLMIVCIVKKIHRHFLARHFRADISAPTLPRTTHPRATHPRTTIARNDISGHYTISSTLTRK